MKKKTNLLLCTLALFTLSLNAIGTEPVKMTSDEAKALFYKTMSTDYNTPLSPSKDTGAQWFPKAGFGLFIHWGIHSVVPINPSWSMIKNCFKQKRPAKVPMEEYYKLAEKFNPQHYDPNKWLAMAKSIGMQYAVLTTKHHDGYAMWPSKYGEYNTQIYMNGRDLVKDYVAACRKYGLKVGFYYSPRDWGYNHHKSNFSAPMCGFDHLAKSEMIFKGDECQKEYLKWVDYTVGQLSELLTQYGRVDVLWFDGGVWKGAKGADVYEKRIRNWIYKLQPGIVINPRWGGAPINPDYKNHKVDSHTKKLATSIGDFLTFEQKFDAIHERSEVLYTKAWFEYCRTWYGHWGHVPATSAKPKIATIQKILCQLAILRSFGGNMLLNVGPSKDGELRPDIYSEAAILAKWMQKNRESLIGTTPVKTWEKHAARPLTENGKNLYLLIPVNCGKFKQKKKKHTPIWNDKEFPNVFTLKDIPKPLNIVHLSSGKKVEFNYDETKKELVIKEAAEKDNLMNVYKLEYSSAPVLP